MIPEISKYVKNNHLAILVSPNSRKTEILSYDPERNLLKVAIAARPEDNAANIEVVKFFSKLLKRKVRIKSGLRSREKLLFVPQL